MTQFLRRTVATATCSLLATAGLVAVATVGSPADAAAAATASYSAASTSNLLTLSANVPARTLAGLQVGASDAVAGAQPQASSATASNIRANVVNTAIPIQKVTQNAPPDHANATTDGFDAVSAPPLLATGAVDASAQARSAASNSQCLTSGTALSRATTSTASVTVGDNVVPRLVANGPALGDAVDTGAISSSGDTSLVALGGTNTDDTRAVQSTTRAVLSTVGLLGGAVKVKAVGPALLSAQATGTTATSGANYVAPLVTVQVGDAAPLNLNTAGHVTLHLGRTVGGTGVTATVALTLGAITGVTNSGTAVSAKATVLTADISVDSFVAGLDTSLLHANLGLAPLSVSASGPADGVQCGQTPVPAPNPVITSPTQGSTVGTNPPAIIGTGSTGDTVTVKDAGGKTLCTTTVIAGTWRCTPTSPLPAGPTTVTATESNGTTSGTSDPVTFTVAPNAPAKPTISSPANGSTVHSATPPISGSGTTGDTVEVTESGAPVCGPVAVTGGAWTCTPVTALGEGSHTVVATQRDGTGGATDSAPDTFNVATSATSVPAPVITSPADGATVNNGTVAFTGTGVAGDTVSVTQNGDVLCSALVNSAGQWHCSPVAALTVGPHTVVATQKDPKTGVTSGPSNTVTFVTAVVGTRYVPKTPYRVLDTRSKTKVGSFTGPVRANGSVRLSAGDLKLPAGTASAVALNVTVDAPATGGFVTAYPSDQTQPVVSSLNFATGQTRPNLVIVPVAADGSVTLYTNATTQLVADVFGYFATKVVTTSGGLFHAVTPARLLDTRTGGQHPLGSGETRSMTVTGKKNVPSSGVEAVLVNITVSKPTHAGYVSAFPTGSAFHRTTSNVNFVHGDLASTRAIVPVGTGGAISLFNFAGSTPTVIDVTGYFTSSGSGDVSGAQFVPVSPRRAIDSRAPAVNTSAAPLGPKTTRAVTLTGGAIPTAGTVAVVTNATAVGPTRAGYLTQYASGAAKPGVSDLNFTAKEIVPNLSITQVSSSGKANVYNFAGATNFLEDVSGYFTAPDA